MRRRAQGRDGLRELLAAGCREKSRDFARRFGGLDAATATDAELDAEARRIGCYDWRADALERGEAATFSNWQLPRDVLPDCSFPDMAYFWRVERDGTVTPLADYEP
jgi:hypothetical protein